MCDNNGNKVRENKDGKLNNYEVDLDEVEIIANQYDVQIWY